MYFIYHVRVNEQNSEIKETGVKYRYIIERELELACRKIDRSIHKIFPGTKVEIETEEI
jgi:hypothetical protein